MGPDALPLWWLAVGQQRSVPSLPWANASQALHASSAPWPEPLRGAPSGLLVRDESEEARKGGADPAHVNPIQTPTPPRPEWSLPLVGALLRG